MSILSAQILVSKQNSLIKGTRLLKEVPDSGTSH